MSLAWHIEVLQRTPGNRFPKHDQMLIGRTDHARRPQTLDQQRATLHGLFGTGKPAPTTERLTPAEFKRRFGGQTVTIPART